MVLSTTIDERMREVKLNLRERGEKPQHHTIHWTKEEFEELRQFMDDNGLGTIEEGDTFYGIKHETR